MRCFKRVYGLKMFFGISHRNHIYSDSTIDEHIVADYRPSSYILKLFKHVITERETNRVHSP